MQVSGKATEDKLRVCEETIDSLKTQVALLNQNLDERKKFARI